jgi:hypothetical protein
LEIAFQGSHRFALFSICRGIGQKKPSGSLYHLSHGQREPDGLDSLSIASKSKHRAKLPAKVSFLNNGGRIVNGSKGLWRKPCDKMCAITTNLNACSPTRHASFAQKPGEMRPGKNAKL